MRTPRPRRRWLLVAAFLLAAWWLLTLTLWHHTDREDGSLKPPHDTVQHRLGVVSTSTARAAGP